MATLNRRRYAVTSVAHGQPLPAGRVHLASYGAGVVTPGTPVVDVLFYTEPGLLTAPPRRVRASLTGFAPGTPVPGYYRLVSEAVGTDAE